MNTTHSWHPAPYFRLAVDNARSEFPPTDANFHMAAAVGELARTIWETRNKGYRIDARPWRELEPSVKQIFVLQAQDIMRANRPCDNASLAVIRGER